MTFRLVRVLAALILFVLAAPSVNSSAVLIADFSMSRMIELSARYPFCRLHNDRGDIQRMLLSADPRRIRQVPRDSVLALEAVCRDADGIDGKHQGGLGFIYPGTKWCGPGNSAADFNDLGRYSEEDRCCRDHDLCPNTLAPGECRRGLCNRGGFTRSHCDCDARLRRCLQSLNTETANTLGAVFFNVVQVTCFRERSPCSVWQRSAIQPENECPLGFQLSEFYVPPNDKFIASVANQSFKKLFPSSEDERSIDRTHENEISNFQDNSARIGVKVASIGLVARNLIREAVMSPINGVLDFFRRTFHIGS